MCVQRAAVVRQLSCVGMQLWPCVVCSVLLFGAHTHTTCLQLSCECAAAGLWCGHAGMQLLNECAAAGQ